MQNRYEILGLQWEEDDPEQFWTILSDYLCQTNETVPRKRRRRRGNKWTTNEIFELMDQRRLLQDNNLTRYKEINKQIKRECNIMEEQWFNRYVLR